jgi:hypothetical protein
MLEVTVPVAQKATRLEKLIQRPSLVITIVCGLAMLIYIALLPVPRATKNLFSSDGMGYFVILRSLVIDHDLDVSDDDYYLNNTISNVPVLPKYTVGMALLWLPFYLVAHGLVSFGHFLGLPVFPDGYNRIYQFAVCIGSMFWGYIGLLLVLRICREFFKTTIALVATLLIAFGWNVVYYFILENSMSHMTSLMAVSGLIAWWRFTDKRRVVLYWSGIGALAALAAMIRPQDSAFLILPGLDLLVQSINSVRQKDWQKLLQVIKQGFILAITFIVAYTPQLAASYKAYGTPLTTGYSLASESFDLNQPHLPEVLFSTYHGLFLWHPLILLAVLGLFFLAKLDRSYTLKLAAALVIQTYIIASWHVWWQGDSFGSRMFINSTPIFALGLAGFLAYLKTHLGWWSIWTLALFSLTWNFLFIIQYRFDLIPKGLPITWKQLTIDKLTVFFDLLHHKSG